MTTRTLSSPNCPVPAGHYAMFYKPTGKVRFFTLSFGNPKGKWAYFPFLDEHAGPNRIPVKNRALKEQIINKIATDIPGCLRMFAQNTGRCGICGKELTDPDSRKDGIGPICKAKIGGLGVNF